MSWRSPGATQSFKSGRPSPITTVNHAHRGGPKRGARRTGTPLTLPGARRSGPLLDLLRGTGSTARSPRSPSPTATGGQMPAGSLIFGADDRGGRWLPPAEAAGVFFERGVGAEAGHNDPAQRGSEGGDPGQPAVVLTEDDTSWSLRQIFGRADVGFVSMVTGKGSLERASTDPLENYDVIYNTGQNYPAAKYGTARARLQAFFQRGGGYIGTSVSSANFSFLNQRPDPDADPGNPDPEPATRRTGVSPGGGMSGRHGPLTGGFSTTDNLYLPVTSPGSHRPPSGATVDGRTSAR